MDELAKFDPLTLKSPVGVISKGKSVCFKLKLNPDILPKEVLLIIREDSQTTGKTLVMKREGDFCVAEETFENSGHFWYYFQLNFDGWAKFVCKTYDNYSVVLDEKGEEFFQLVTEQEYTCTNSLQGGVIYQILVDRFCKVGKVKERKPLILRDDWGGEITKNTDDPLIINLEVFGGNFNGVLSKLDYLKDLGVTVIYFNPISLANSHHKYNTANYMQVDDMFGTEEEFEKLVLTAKQKGIKIIIDGVYNHTGSDSIYFNKEKNFDTIGAYNSKDSKWFEWYEFTDYPDKYTCWWGIETLPNVVDTSESFRNYIAGKGGVIEKYMKQGVYGFRLDVLDELSDDFAKIISNKIKSINPEAPIIGEVWEDAATKIAYSERKKYFAENEINSVMNYPVKETVLNYIKTQDPFELNSTLRMLINNYPKVVLDNLMNFLGTHDTGRIINELEKVAENNLLKTKQLLKIATGIIFMLPGVPSIFYGDEYGMENNLGSSRGCFDWSKTNNDITDWYKVLTNIRRLDVMKDGKLNVLVSKRGKFIFERYSKTEHIVVLTSLDEVEEEIQICGNFISLLTKKQASDFVLKNNQIEILYEKI